ncbi:hypothetical protein MACK_002128 [Theileria orientalis]|uniref:Uncharacterized protein n=1 Tax=Theileria orientalis TaxID=68886 RepID=A0A976MB96_THEOR|nr:hypothetical protein MACK_002128 [Theileria orientalis]
MIFTFGPPDIYVLPKDVSNSTHGSEDNESNESLKEEIDYEILCVKISYCNRYIFILTKRELLAYSNGSEFVYLGRLKLSELQVSEFESFRDLVILPVSNLIGLVVDNQKHLLIVNYQNPNVNDATLSNTPIQSPSNKTASTNSGSPSNIATSSSNNATSAVGSEVATSTTMSTTSVATIVNNRLLGAANLGNKLTRILSPIEDEEVGDLKETFFLYLKNFLNFRVVYHILVPSDFSFMFVVNQQFFFWIEEQSGLYSTVSAEGFLNMLINHFNSLKRKDEGCRRIDLYLVTTNLLNNVNIIGNIHLSYGLCYISLQSITIKTSVDTGRSIGEKARDDVEGQLYKNMVLQNENDSLFNLIYSCIGNINKTMPDTFVGSTSSNEEVSQNEEPEEEKGPSIDANSILELLEMNSTGPEELVENSIESEEKYEKTEEKVISDIESCFIVNNYLFLLSRSHVLLYLHIQSPNDENNTSNSSVGVSPSSSSNQDVYDRDDDQERGDRNGSDSKKELGRILSDNVENIFINKKHNLLCVLFRNNVMATYHLKCLHRAIAVLEINEKVEDISWLDTSLLVLTCEGKVHFYTYSMRLLHKTSLNIKKSVTRQVNSGSTIPRTSTYNVSNPVESSDKTGDSNSVSSSSSDKDSNDNNNITDNIGTDDNDNSNNSNNTANNNNAGNNTINNNTTGNNSANTENNVTSRASKTREGDKEESERAHGKVRSGLLMGINNNRKLLMYKSGNIMISHPYIDYGGSSNFHVFLNNNNMLILSPSALFSPIMSLGAHGGSINKDMFTLRLPNLNHVQNDEEDEDEERPHRIQIVKNIKINNTGNYILIHHTTTGVDERGGLILFNNNKYTYANTNMNTNDIVRVNWFTNHIFYTITYEGWSNGTDPLFGVKSNMKTEKAYKINFYSINNTNEVLIEVESKSRPVCTCKENPYLFILLDEENKLHCYDLFFIKFKEQYSFSINDLKKYNVRDDKNDVRDYWIEMYVFGHKKFLLLNGYRQLYLVNDEYIEHLVDDVNQVVINNDNNSVANTDDGNSQYEYMVTTNDKTYVLYNHYDRSTGVGVELSEKRSRNNANHCEDGYDKYIFRGEYSRRRLLGQECLGMYEVQSTVNRSYILNMNDNIAFMLNTSTGINVNYALVPSFTSKRKINSRKPLNSNNNNRNDKNSNINNGSSKNSNSKDQNSGFCEEKDDHDDNEQQQEEQEDEQQQEEQEDEQEEEEDDDEQEYPKHKQHLFMEYLIYYLNLVHREQPKKSTEIKKMLMKNLTKKTRNKLFSIFSRKNNELEKINEQEDEFGIKCEECFDYLLEKEEYEYASLLLLPIQTKTNPYRVRSDQCKRVVRRILLSIISSSPQKGRKLREKNKALLQMLVKFYHRLPDVRSIDEEMAKSLSQRDLSKNEDGSYDERSGIDVTGTSATEQNVDESTSNGGGLSEHGDDNAKPDRGIDAIIDMKELVESLQSKLNFMAIYKLSFLSRMGIGSEYLINDLSKSEDKLDGSENSADADTVDSANTVSSTEALQPMELNTMLYFIMEFNHINCKIFSHTGHRKCHYNNFIVGDKMLFYMLMGYKSYIGLSSLLLRNETIYEYVKSIIDEAEGEVTEDSGDRLTLLRNLLFNIKRTYTLS